MSNSTNTSPTYKVEDRGSVLLGNALAFASTALIIVALRIGFRLSRRTIAATDYFITIAMFLSLTHSCLDAISVVRWGYGKHEADLPPSIRNGEGALKLFYVGQIIFKATVMFTKLSLFFVYRGLLLIGNTFWVRLSRGLNYFTAAIVAGYYTAATFVSIFECSPVEKAWKTSTPGTCINTSAFLYTTAGMNVITSLLIIFIPLPVLLRIMYRKTEVAQLIGLILLGFVYVTYLGSREEAEKSRDTGASIARMILVTSSAAQQKTDSTWTLVNSTTAAIVELNVAIIAASLVVMRPCFRAIYYLIFPGQGTYIGHTISGDHTGCAIGSSNQHSSVNQDGIFKTVDVELSGLSRLRIFYEQG